MQLKYAFLAMMSVNAMHIMLYTAAKAAETEAHHRTLTAIQARADADARVALRQTPADADARAQIPLRLGGAVD